jgi:hypothetical protein
MKNGLKRTRVTTHHSSTAWVERAESEDGSGESLMNPKDQTIAPKPGIMSLNVQAKPFLRMISL